MLLFLFFFTASGVLFYSPAPIAGLNCPAFMNTQDFSTRAFDFAPFGRNYSIYPVAKPCETFPSQVPPGFAVWMVGDSVPCIYAVAQDNTVAAGGTIIIAGSAFAELSAVGTGGYRPYSVPMVSPGTIVPPGLTLDEVTASAIIQNQLFCSYYPGVFPNVTLKMDDFPVPNPLAVQFQPKTFGQTPSGMDAWTWLGQICGIFVMCMAVGKWSAFYVATDSFFSFPQIMMLSCFNGGVWVFLLTIMGFSGITLWWPYSSDIAQFFQLWSWAAVATSALVMGVYFREISQLTSSSAQSGVFGILKWPTVAVVIILWIGMIAGGAVNAADPPGSGSNGNSQFPIAFLVFAFAVGGGMLLFGIISLLLSLGEVASTMKSSVIRILIVSLITVLFMWSFGIVSSVVVYFPVETLSKYYGQESTIVFGATLQVFPPFVVLVILMSNFQVSISKEIEVSKSGTSSTSGMSSSSGSSSSSSSSSTSDPVIEL